MDTHPAIKALEEIERIIQVYVRETGPLSKIEVDAIDTIRSMIVGEEIVGLTAAIRHCEHCAEVTAQPCTSQFQAVIAAAKCFANDPTAECIHGLHPNQCVTCIGRDFRERRVECVQSAIDQLERVAKRFKYTPDDDDADFANDCQLTADVLKERLGLLTPPALATSVEKDPIESTTTKDNAW